MYKFYLTQNAKKQFIKLPKKYLKLFLKNIEKIRNNNLHGGTRIKKLNGTTDLWETRLDLSFRMLFSFQQSNIIIHFIILNHDEVKKEIKKKHNVLTQVEHLNTNEPYYHQDDYVIEDASINELYELNIDLLKQSYLALDFSNIEFKLKLLPEQENLLLLPTPLFINGVAGSGKSTILVYRMLLELKQKISFKNINIVLLTENINLLNLLKEYSSKLYSTFGLKADDLNHLNFFSLEDYFHIDPTNKKYLTKSIFYSFLKNYSFGNNYFKMLPPLYCYHLIQQINILSYYKSLEWETVITMLKLNNEEQLHFKSMYQAYLILKKEHNYIDLTDYMFLDSNFKIDILFIDEVQDYPNLYLQQIFKYLNDVDQIVLAGDFEQEIIQTNFQWSQLKSLLYEQNKNVQVHSLQHNFRNNMYVTKLLNRLLNIRRQFSKTNAVEFISNKHGNKPVLLLNTPYNELKYLNDFVFIVPDVATEEMLKLYLNNESTLILQPLSIKGLEFPNICIVNFNSFYTKALKSMHITPKLSTQILKNIYVALSRSSNNLFIFEKSVSHFWLENFGDLLDTSKLNRDYKSQHIENSAWSNYANTFYNRGEYKNSLISLKNIPDAERNIEDWKLYFNILMELENIKNESQWLINKEQEFITFANALSALTSLKEEKLVIESKYLKERMKIKEYKKTKNLIGLMRVCNKLLEDNVDEMDLLEECITVFKENNSKIQHLKALTLKSSLL